MIKYYMFIYSAQNTSKNSSMDFIIQSNMTSNQSKIEQAYINFLNNINQYNRYNWIGHVMIILSSIVYILQQEYISKVLLKSYFQANKNIKLITDIIFMLIIILIITFIYLLCNIYKLKLPLKDSLFFYNAAIILLTAEVILIFWRSQHIIDDIMKAFNIRG